MATGVNEAGSVLSIGNRLSDASAEEWEPFKRNVLKAAPVVLDPAQESPAEIYELFQCSWCHI